MTASSSNVFSFASIGITNTTTSTDSNNTINSSPTTITPICSFKCFNGTVTKYRHSSSACKSNMNFTIFVPDHNNNEKLPTLMFLGGMTNSDDSFIQQGGTIKRASELKLILVCPDTSPRDTGIEGEDDSFDIGSGASFYVDATTPIWSNHYQMYTYIMKEFREMIIEEFPIDSTKMSIIGHSMGGNAALIMAMRHPEYFRSCSAFAPICNPSENQWGQKVFQAYLGSDRSSWERYDAVKVLKSYGGVLPLPTLIDQGGRDFFSRPELGPEFDALTPHRFASAANQSQSQGGHELQFNIREGYDHFYFFIQTFIDTHLDFHASHLGINLSSHSN